MGQSIHSGHRQRMKALFHKVDPSALHAHQLLEILLFFGIPRKDTNELAHRLLNTFGSLSAVMEAPYAELLNVKGMTPGAATLLRVCASVMSACQREKLQGGVILDSTQKLGEYLTAFFMDKQVEQVMLLCLNSVNKLVGSGIVSMGSATAAQINVRQVLQLALRYNATKVVLGHNHPSGFAIPSREDVQTTLAVKQALEMVDIRLIDHIIVADNDYVSMYDSVAYRTLFVPRDS